MLTDIFSFVLGMASIGLFGWFLYEVIKLEKKRAQEHKARQDKYLEVLDSIHRDLASISRSCDSLQYFTLCISDTLDELLDSDDE